MPSSITLSINAAVSRWPLGLLRALAGLAVLACGCSTAPKLAPYPHESVLAVIAELKIFLRLDPYRAEPGRDLAGQNIYRVSLQRLNNLDELVGEEYDDVINFARAECYERLGRWSEAAKAFASAAANNTSLAEEAKIRQQWDEKIVEATGGGESARTLDSFLNHLDVVYGALAQLRESKPAAPYDSFIAVEMERTLERKASFLFENRFVLERGADRATEAAERLVKENAESRRKSDHLLLLGRFQETRARDYVQFNDPTGSDFDLKSWTTWIEQARAAYTKVAQADGDPAKPEGQARLRVLDAFAQRTIERAN